MSALQLPRVVVLEKSEMRTHPAILDEPTAVHGKLPCVMGWIYSEVRAICMNSNSARKPLPFGLHA